MKNFHLVFACDSNLGIGKKNSMPWHLPKEQKYFHEVTSKTKSPQLQNAVIMGRKTWESIPPHRRPLPGRLNIVLTRNPDYQVPDRVHVKDSLDSALTFLDGNEPTDQIFVIGGAGAFREALTHDRCGLLYLTEIDGTFDCDVFLPPYKQHFDLQSSSDLITEKGVAYRYLIYQHKNK